MNKFTFLLVLAALSAVSLAPEARSSSEEEVSTPATWESVRLTAKTTSDRYHITCKYVAEGRRLILIAVVDKKGGSHRVLRRTVKAGSGSFSWSCKKTRFGKLAKAIVAVHLTKGEKQTIGSHTVYFRN